MEFFASRERLTWRECESVVAQLAELLLGVAQPLEKAFLEKTTIELKLYKTLM